jgi:hypothetical protein
MRRALRHLSAMLSTFSLLLCVAAVVAWILSYASPANTIAATNGWNVRSRSGQLVLYHQEPPIPGLFLPPGGLPAGVKPGPASSIHIQRFYPLGQFGTTTNYRWQTSATIRAFGIYVRYSFVAIVAALMAAFSALPAFRGRRRRARAAQGLCPACGYDLRASPERCPECGLRRGSAERTVRADDKVMG